WAHHTVHHRDRDLEPEIRRQHALLAQGTEDKERAHRVARIAEAGSRIAEADPLDPRPDAELPRLVARARQQLLDAVDRLRPPKSFEIGMAVKDQIPEAVNPGPALADFAARQGSQLCPSGAPKSRIT